MYYYLFMLFVHYSTIDAAESSTVSLLFRKILPALICIKGKGNGAFQDRQNSLHNYEAPETENKRNIIWRLKNLRFQLRTFPLLFDDQDQL